MKPLALTREYPSGVMTLLPPEPGANWPQGEFESLFLDNYARLVNLLLRIVGDHARAEELANEALWRLYSQPPPADQRTNLAGWLYRTATRLGIDSLRAGARRARSERLGGGIGKTGGADPLASAIREEERRQVRAVLAGMKPGRAQLLLLRSAGFAYKEIAAVLDVAASSIGTLLARAEAEFESSYLEKFGNQRKDDDGNQ